MTRFSYLGSQVSKNWAMKLEREANWVSWLFPEGHYSSLLSLCTQYDLWLPLPGGLQLAKLINKSGLLSVQDAGRQFRTNQAFYQSSRQFKTDSSKQTVLLNWQTASHLTTCLLLWKWAWQHGYSCYSKATSCNMLPNGTATSEPTVTTCTSPP